jgi:nucleoside diphosphate kinase
VTCLVSSQQVQLQYAEEPGGSFLKSLVSVLYRGRIVLRVRSSERAIRVIIPLPSVDRKSVV